MKRTASDIQTMTIMIEAQLEKLHAFKTECLAANALMLAEIADGHISNLIRALKSDEPEIYEALRRDGNFGLRPNKNAAEHECSEDDREAFPRIRFF